MDIYEFGTAIQRARKSAGLSQAQLAQRAGVSVSRLEAVENSRVFDVGLMFALKVAHALGLDLFLEPSRPRPTLDQLVAEAELAARR